MPWEVEHTNEFEAWWDSLDEQEQDAIDAASAERGIRWYDEIVPAADALYDEHLAEISETRERRE